MVGFLIGWMQRGHDPSVEGDGTHHKSLDRGMLNVEESGDGRRGIKADQ